MKKYWHWKLLDLEILYFIPIIMATFTAAKTLNIFGFFDNGVENSEDVI